MITKFEKYNENIKSLLVGPTEKEIMSNITNPEKLLNISIDNNFENGIITSIENGAKLNILQLQKLADKKLKKSILFLFENDITNIKYNSFFIQTILDNGLFELPFLIKKIPTSMLQYAVDRGIDDIIIPSIQNGADVQFNGNNVLYNIIKNNKYNFIKILIEYGADIKSYNFTLMRMILSDAPLDLIEFILDKVVFSYEQYNEISRFSINNPHQKDIINLVNKSINKHVTYDTEKEWKPYKSVYDNDNKQWFKENESIKNLLVGPTEDEIIDNLKHKFIDGRIDLITYYSKCKEYNIKDGPTKEEVWKSLGYDRIFNTPEEFILYMIDGMKIEKQITKEQIINTIYWENHGKTIFRQDLKSHRLWVSYKSIWIVLSKVFGFSYQEIILFMKEQIEKHLNWKGFILNPLP